MGVLIFDGRRKSVLSFDEDEENAVAPDGAQGVPTDVPYTRGQSAYEAALEDGFVGTKSQWLASLRGPAGSGGGGGGGVSEYVAFTFASPLLEWHMVHNFGTYAVTVDTFDQNGLPIEGEVLYPDENNVIVKWYSPLAGSARIKN